MKLSKNFSLAELTTTSTSGSNVPTLEHTDKLLYVSQYLLQPVRDEFGAVIVNSGYRSPVVNAAIGGSETSQHPKGEAADFKTPDADLWEVYLWIIENLTFGQCIFEEKNITKWIHLSLPRLDKMNQQALLFKDGEYKVYGG
jgi:hypothetical protein